jgi:hypothetical protein
LEEHRGHIVVIFYLGVFFVGDEEGGSREWRTEREKEAIELSVFAWWKHQARFYGHFTNIVASGDYSQGILSGVG